MINFRTIHLRVGLKVNHIISIILHYHYTASNDCRTGSDSLAPPSVSMVCSLFEMSWSLCSTSIMDGRSLLKSARQRCARKTTPGIEDLILQLFPNEDQFTNTPVYYPLEDLSKNSVHHNALKHIHVRYHFVRDCVTSGKLGLEKISTVNNISYGITKYLASDRFRSLLALDGL